MFRGDFYEPFELEAYPFDAQPLKMVLRTMSLCVILAWFQVLLSGTCPHQHFSLASLQKWGHRRPLL
jgi:hypothetical protein